jgi:hypothetical protein
MRRCRCDGANESCAFCFGTGFVGPISRAGSPKPTPPTLRPATKTDEHARPALVTCPLCDTQIPFNEVGLHTKTAHRPSPVRRREAHKANVSNRETGPKETQNRESSRRADVTEFIFKHLPARWDKLGPKYILTCRQCGREMNQALLPGHLRDVHGVRDPFELIRVGGRFSNGPRLGRRQPASRRR